MVVKTFPDLIVVYVVFIFNRNKCRCLVYLVLCLYYFYSSAMGKQYGLIKKHGGRAK
jgi:hypothetical protein